MPAALLQLGHFKLSFVTSQCGLLQSSLKLCILPAIVLIFQVKLLLQLIDFDLELNPALSLEIVGFEELHLQ